ncbi:MAG: lysis system o-spanin lipoprotein Rz1, partial [Gammaproteobacteria bacterium]|nr:lysis system o-spanin lipoprotein Rz1 [Gammaproteobacteria bacterium]
IASCPIPPAPAAWAMEPASNSVSELDQLFGISGAE